MLFDNAEQHRRTLRSLLDDHDIVVAAGAWDGASAAIAESVGIEAVFVGGWQIAAGQGLPDAELYTKTHGINSVRTVASRTSAAVIADIDTGFGSASHAFHTVRSYEDAGACAMMIEDQVAPKQACHWLVEGGSLAGLDYQVRKIRAAAAARRSEETILIARTDAEGEEILRRAEAYVEAGAEMICAISTSPEFDPASWKRLHEAVGVPLVSTPIPGTWQEREFTPEVLREIGVRLVAAGLQPFNAAMGAIQRVYRGIKEGTSIPDLSDGAMPTEEFGRIIGLYEAIELERSYTGDLPA